MAVNHYTARLVTAGTMGLVPSHENDQGVKEFIDSSWQSSATDWLKVFFLHYNLEFGTWVVKPMILISFDKENNEKEK